MTCERFDIWLADLEPGIGTESGKTRPVLVLQSDLLNKDHPSTIICPLTTNIKEGVEILRVNIDDDISGLKRPSAVMIDQLRAIDNRRLIKKIGILPSDLTETVISNIKIVLDIDV